MAYYDNNLYNSTLKRLSIVIVGFFVTGWLLSSCSGLTSSQNTSNYPGTATELSSVNTSNTSTPSKPTIKSVTHTPKMPQLKSSTSTMTPSHTASSTITPHQSATSTTTPSDTPIDPRMWLEPGLYPVYWSYTEGKLSISTLDGSKNYPIVTNRNSLFSLSPRGNQIAYFDEEYDILIYDLFSGITLPLSQPSILPSASYYGTSGPEWSPDGRRIAFSASTIQVIDEVVSFDEFPSLWVSFLEHDEFLRLTSWSYVETDPVWSPDGNWLAFAADESKVSFPNGNFVGETEIYILNTNCLTSSENCINTTRQLTDKGRYGNGSFPTWSPDSKQLAYVCGIREDLDSDDNEQYQTDICAVDLDGSNLRNLTNTYDSNENGVSWSPDGNQIVFVREWYSDVFSSDIFLVRVAGGEAENVTNNPEEKKNKPIWSPDGKYIAYSSRTSWPKPETLDVILVSIDSGEAMNITNTPEEDEFFIFWLILD